MNLMALANGYMTGKVYLLWSIPYDKINYFEILRNDIPIAHMRLSEKDGVPYIHTDLGNADPFIHPCLFDHDHHTNLFWKDSTHQLMYVDEDVHKFQEYKYEIIAKRINEKEEVMDEIHSNIAWVQTQ